VEVVEGVVGCAIVGNGCLNGKDGEFMSSPSVAVMIMIDHRCFDVDQYITKTVRRYQSSSKFRCTT
jgi:hypothetical protein